MAEFVQVFARIKPSRSDSLGLQVVGPNQIISDARGRRTHVLHKVFDGSAGQAEVYRSVGFKIVEGCLQGLNGTIFAYGQTGSGKTHTMLGPATNEGFLYDGVQKGVISRAIEHLFNCLEERSKKDENFVFNVRIQFIELYNEQIFDLLHPEQKKIHLRNLGSDIQLDASSFKAQNVVDAMQVVKTGWAARRTGETKMNRESSRSHAVVIVNVEMEEPLGEMIVRRTSILNFVDLAGSERQKHSQAAGERLKEASHINGSLSVLSRVIRILSKGGAEHIPYRESNLTHLLKNSLGGNSKTAVIVSLHADLEFAQESLQTLQFAEACASIRNKVQANEVMSGDCEKAYKKTIKDLTAEIRALKENASTCDEQTQQKLSKLQSAFDKQTAELAALRTKYECKIISNMAENEEQMEELVQTHLTNCKPPVTLGDIEGVLLKNAYDKIATVELELQEQKQLKKMSDHERMELSERYTELLNGSIQIMKTPKRKSRNPRRDTMFMFKTPLTEVPDENLPTEETSTRIMELEANLQLAHTQITEKEKTIEILSDKCVKMGEEMSKLAEQLAAVSTSLEKEESLHSTTSEKLNSIVMKYSVLKKANLEVKAANDELKRQFIELEKKIEISQNELQLKEDEMEKLKKKMTITIEYSKQTGSKINSVETALKETTTRLKEVEATATDLQQSCDVLMEELDIKKKKIMKLEKMLAEAEQELDQVQKSRDIEREKLIKEKETECEKLTTRHRTELDSVERRLECEQEAHERSRKQILGTAQDLSSKFELKMKQMRSEFEENSFLERQRLNSELEQRDAMLLEKENVVNRLEQKVDMIQAELAEKITQLAEFGSHTNHKQKLKVFMKNREDFLKTREENDELRAQLEKLKVAQPQPDSLHEDAPSRQLRSRNRKN